MCIIAAKPAGIAMPSADTISNMWNHNSDGAGFMYAKDGKVHIEKGFMCKKDFDKALANLGKRIDLKRTPVIMHFRITTHGGTSSSNTHPFPISDNLGMLQKLTCKTNLAVAHNGIISSVFPGKNISDTMEYVMTQLAPLYKGVPDFLDKPSLMTLIENATSSKLAFLKGNGDIYTIGNFVEDNGIKYSNTSYEPYTSVYSKSLGAYSKCYGWDDYGYGGFPSPRKGYKSLDGSYQLTLLKPMYDCDDNFITDCTGSMLTDNGFYAVDATGQAYEYDENYDAYIEMDGAYGTNLDGQLVQASDDDVESYEDYVFVPHASRLYDYLDDNFDCEPSNKKGDK